jgi:hypothetical protein
MKSGYVIFISGIVVFLLIINMRLFHINRDLIEQGIDENDRKFYKIYYQEET